MQDIGQRLTATIDASTPRLAALTDPGAPLAPGKWSAKEVLGHLLDSCSVNHERLLRARGTEDLVLLGYPQDEWVAAQGYQEADWMDLLALFELANQRFAAVISHSNDEDARRLRPKHNLHEICAGKWPAEEPGTLRWLMSDYVDHLEHHLGQILPA